MDLSEENTSILYKNTIKYLHDLAEKVPNTLNVLKSYYAAKFRISELQTKICLEKNKNRADAMCPRCCLKLRENEASHIVRAETKKSKFAQKMLRKVEGNKRLTKFQTKYLKKNKNNPKAINNLVITCNFCKKEVIYECIKPVKSRDVNGNKIMDNKNRKKAKKKKDRFCGLQQEVVTAVQTQANTFRNNQNTTKNHLQNGNNNNAKTNGRKKVLNNPISTRREKIQQQKNVNKLVNFLNQNSDTKKSKSCLSQFLQSLNK